MATANISTVELTNHTKQCKALSCFGLIRLSGGRRPRELPRYQRPGHTWGTWQFVSAPGVASNTAGVIEPELGIGFGSSGFRSSSNALGCFKSSCDVGSFNTRGCCGSSCDVGPLTPLNARDSPAPVSPPGTPPLGLPVTPIMGIPGTRPTRMEMSTPPLCGNGLNMRERSGYARLLQCWSASPPLHRYLNAPLAGGGAKHSSPGNVQVSGSAMQYAGYHY